MQPIVKKGKIEDTSQDGAKQEAGKSKQENFKPGAGEGG
jgi:hypothetical protein